MYSYFFFNETATTEIYTLSLHDALPIYRTRYACWPPWPPPMNPVPPRGSYPPSRRPGRLAARNRCCRVTGGRQTPGDRKSTRLNSSHAKNSEAGFCFKKKQYKLL